MTAILSMERVSCSYGPFRALYDVDLEIEPGQALGLLGQNGAGKSTIARVASGLVPLSSGTLRIDGHALRRPHAEQIRRLGVLHIPEGRGVFASLSVEENLRVSLMAQPRKRRKQLLGEIYDRFSILGERRRARAGTLSGGQQRLLSLAPAFVAPPRLLIADELSLGLAPNVLDEIWASLEQLRASGVTLLIIEQQVDRILDLVDVASVVDHGRIIHTGPPADALSVLEAGLRRQGGLEG
jgi:branched-chain amino acid transport system ATP-binding protein